MQNLSETHLTANGGTVQTAGDQSDDRRNGFSFIQLMNMNVGFLGIQFGWGLQMANMSAIFEYLGANAHSIPILWIAAPVTGLIVQPIIGNLSDLTWTRLGRRRPYFLVGAVLAAIALIIMPSVSTLWMAVLLLWILDTSNNVSMEPFRAFVGDLLPEHQRTQGFAVQSLMIGLGLVSASLLPWILSHVFKVPESSGSPHSVPLAVGIAFYTGAIVYLGTILWTVFTTEEHPPADLGKLEQQQAEHRSWPKIGQAIWRSLLNLPTTMAQLAWVQLFTWIGLFCFFLYFPPAVARNIFGATAAGSVLYGKGIEWAGVCIAAYNLACVGFSFLLPILARRTSKQLTHGLSLLCGAVSLMAIAWIHTPSLLLIPMLGIGMTWASVLAMPYALLSGTLPKGSEGTYFGIFNFFIVLPQILVSLCFGWVMEHWLGDDRILALVVSGGCLAIAALLVYRVKEVSPSEPSFKN